MHILFLTDNFPPESNAPANRTFEHAREWVALGHTVTVITCAPNFPTGVVYKGYKNKWYQTEVMDGIKVVRVKTYMTANARFTRRIFDFLSFMVMGLLASLFQPKPDAVVATSPQFFCGVAGALSSILKGVPFVLEVRDLYPDAIVAVGVMPDRPSIKCLKMVEGWMYRRASLIIIVSEAFRSTISARVKNPDKIKFVVNGVSTAFINPDSITAAPPGIANQLDNSFVVGYIGTHGRSQRLGTVLQAAALLQHEKSIHFLMVGDGEKKAEIEKWVSEEGLTNVTLIPHQKRENILGYISLCDIALVPLRNLRIFSKVIPSKIFEFMAIGIPIIISVPKGAATDIVRQERCGLITEPENPAQLKGAILKLHKDTSLRNTLGRNGKQASGKYRREELAKHMLGHIKTVLESNSKVSSVSEDMS